MLLFSPSQTNGKLGSSTRPRQGAGETDNTEQGVFRVDLHRGRGHRQVDGILPFFLQVTHCQAERERKKPVSINGILRPHMLAVETERNQLLFFKHLTNIPKWLVAQKESKEKCPEPRIHSAILHPRRRVPDSHQARPGCFHHSLQHMTMSWKLLGASRSTQGC